MNLADWNPDNVAVGDLRSDAVGSGARFNAGKVPIELIPFNIIAHQYLLAGYDPQFIGALSHLGSWQEGGGTPDLQECLDRLGKPREVMEACARVFDYGRKKYAAWNWAKGMPWSIPLACAGRHLCDLIEGEKEDHESHLPLIGHVACNVVMLLTYHRTYTQGDDRTPYLRNPK